MVKCHQEEIKKASAIRAAVRAIQEVKMKLLLLICACAAVTSAYSLEARDKRFLSSVANFFSHAAETVKDGVVSAAHAVAGAAETAAHAVADAAETAVDAVGDAAETAVDALQSAGSAALDGIEHAADVVGDAFSHAAHEIADFASEAAEVLGPILDQVAQTVGPIAKSILDAAIAKLIEEAPSILTTLGELGVQELVTTLLSSAVGKRDAASTLESLELLFKHLVEEGVNSTVKDVHKVVGAVNKFNAELKKETGHLKQALSAGQDVQVAARQFFLNALAAVKPLVDVNAFAMDVSRFDDVIPKAIRQFESKLREVLARIIQKRGVLQDLAQEFLTLLQEGQQQVGQLANTLESLAQGFLAPTLQNIKQVAQALLDNSSAVTSQLISEALTLLAPFQEQLGPLFQQVQTLAAQFGLAG